MVAVTTYSDARQNLAKLLDRVAKDREPVIVARKKRGSVVFVSLAEWNSIQETLHLISTRANTRALLEAMEQADRGEFAKEMSSSELRNFIKARTRKRARRPAAGKPGAAKKRRRRIAKIQREAAE
jgi:antitoxin YefM